MKKIYVLYLLLVGCLCGCSALVEREYQTIEPFFESPVTVEGEQGVLRVEDYPELVNTVLYLVGIETTEGIIELVDYMGDVEYDLAQVCAEVRSEDPLGAYLVEDITYEYTRVATTYEVALTISYRYGEGVAGQIVSVSGESAIGRALEVGLEDFSSTLLLRMSYFDQDEAYLQSMLAEIYYKNPQVAFGLPTMEVDFYPETGIERIASITLTYPLTPEVQLVQKKEQNLVIAEWVTELEELEREEQWIALMKKLNQTVTLLESDSLIGGSTPWNVLVQGVGDHEGLALTVALLAEELELNCVVTRGTCQEVPWIWNCFPDGQEGIRYLDLTLGDGGIRYDAQNFAQMGYYWEEGYPELVQLEEDQAINLIEE